MDSDSDSPFNYSWPSFPKMKIRRRASRQGRSFDGLKSKHSPTFLAAGRLSDMLNGGDEVYTNCMVIDQVGDLDINYINIEGIPANTTPESMDSTCGSRSGKNTLPGAASAGACPRCDHSQGTANALEAQPCCLAPPSACVSSLNLSFGLHGFDREQSHLKKRSSSLDALDADSEGEGRPERSHMCYTPGSQSSSQTGIPSGDELDSFDTSTEPDFNISRAESLSFSSNLQSKESLFSGIRSRSYSCSSPKISLGKSRLVRDFTVCNSREEQRAYSLPEPPEEKRTEDEEWDKYIMPVKSESERYKVSRTFSFLMNRMTGPRNKSKTKSKDAKDKEKLSRHQFVPGSFSGLLLQCWVCDKPFLGKESFQCSTWLVLCECYYTPGSAFPSPHILDVVESSLWSDLSSDAHGFEGESWSLVVDPSFCSRQEKEVVKRQDVIFELMQTEMHHLQTLLSMSEIFRRGMKEELQLDHSTVDKIFPCLDELLQTHRHFFCSLKERRQEACVGNDRNFVIDRIGDLLVQQLQNSNLLARRRGIPECILLVTQRITKYPVLVERILQYTKERTDEHRDLCRALCLIKDIIAAVDLKVSEYEKNQKWLDILNKIENKTCTKLKNGHVFRKQALISKERTLLYDGLVYWKTATGRFKDILALLLSDVLLFLQEKDQKYIFAAVDQKPPVISLQKLIAREVANEERGMFLISASSSGPEMYEIHTNSKEERNNWMRRIQQAVESCPEEEGGRTSELDEERRKAEARAAKIQQCQELLSNQDQQICTYLEEKLHIYAELGELSGFEEVHLEPHLLIKPDPGEPPQAASLLAAALKEAESLQVAVKASRVGDVSPPSEESCVEPGLTDALGSGAGPAPPSDGPGLSAASPVTEGPGGSGCWDVDPGIRGVVADLAVSDAGEKVEYRSFPGSSQSEIIQAIQNLTRLLYSLQAALTIQDSHIEIHRLVLQQQERLALGHPLRGGLFQDLEKQREELANVHGLQQQFQQEQRRWHRACDQQLREQRAKESWLQERERECQSQEELLLRDRGQLAHQLQEYQQNLERLREGQRLVAREREQMRTQHRLLCHWKHSRQSSLPAAFPPGGTEVMDLSRSESLGHENSFFVNEAFVRMSLNTSNQPTPSDTCQDATDPQHASNSDLVRTSGNQADLKMDVSQPLDVAHELWSAPGSCHQTPPLQKSSKDSCNNDLVASLTERPHPQDSPPPRPRPEAKLSLQTTARQDAEKEDPADENIVYL
ncbi:rho guanine nucleotide exchange factor 28 [Echinops telfairi]|uniref:Rho guanine nucleotide exchange factor 28 n=1 Tax=Echinops telfairi TaxID=9371 RepID=A0AC55CPQ8_ECHTE|nr:rho guanine nucleotide exchange factor 28 [Echinops telfairi]